MIKTLQKRFIFTAMAAVSLLLFVMLGAINGADYWLLDKEADRMLHMLSENGGRIPPKMPPREKAGFFNSPMNEDMAMAARFFVVAMNKSGEVEYTELSKISSVTEEEAKMYGVKASSSGEDFGNIGQFKYKITIIEEKMTVVFLDRTRQIRSFLLVLVISVSIGMFCWILMLLFVTALSKKAIIPIVENIEKQKQFVTNAGHEIKTPLAIILANTDALELHAGESKWSKNIRSQTIRLGGLMQNLLILSKMEEGGMKLAVSNFSMTKQLVETLQSFYESASLKGIAIQEDITPDIMYRGNEEHIRQLCSILLDNAIKYTPSKGEISVSLKNQENSILLKISNTCGKLPGGKPEKLFDRFYRDDTSRTQKNGGYGIGLSVARAIALAHKGRITAEYKEPNTVIFFLKL